MYIYNSIIFLHLSFCSRFKINVVLYLYSLVWPTIICSQQQSERYISSAYEGGGELSPVAPAASPGSPRNCTSCRKREPPDETAQPPGDDPCAGCGSRITDRFYLLALERRWHTPCLRCCECKMPLDSEQRCYARDSNIFCKNDYFRWVVV